MFSDSDLIGVPYKIIVGKQYLENKNLEIKERVSDKTFTISENSNSVQANSNTIEAVLKIIFEKNQ